MSFTQIYTLPQPRISPLPLSLLLLLTPESLLCSTLQTDSCFFSIPHSALWTVSPPLFFISLEESPIHSPSSRSLLKSLSFWYNLLHFSLSYYEFILSFTSNFSFSGASGKTEGMPMVSNFYHNSYFKCRSFLLFSYFTSSLAVPTRMPCSSPGPPHSSVLAS